MHRDKREREQQKFSFANFAEFFATFFDCFVSFPALSWQLYLIDLMLSIVVALHDCGPPRADTPRSIEITIKLRLN